MSFRVLFIAPSAYPLGGVAGWLEYLLPGLASSGFDCVLGLVHGRCHDTQGYLARHPWDNCIRIAYQTGSHQGRINAILKGIQDCAPDVVMVANVFDTYEAIRRIRIRGGESPRVVMTLHGLQEDSFADIRTESEVLDAVVATNRLAQSLAAESLGDATRVLYAPYGVPSGACDAQDQVPRSTPLKILYSGRLDQRQKRILDLPDLLKVLEEMGLEVRLSIAGGGPDEGLLRERASLLGVDKSIDFLGTLAAKRLATEYQRHHALIVTSCWETGPIVAWEAMSHRLPVLSSRYVGSGLEGALRDGENCLLFPIGDIAAAANAAARLVDPHLRSHIARGGIDLVESRYAEANSVQAWKDALDRIIQFPPLRPIAEGKHIEPSGRLDRIFGIEGAERVRSTLGISFKHSDAGGEWPHTGHPNVDQESFLARANAADREK